VLHHNLGGAQSGALYIAEGTSSCQLPLAPDRLRMVQLSSGTITTDGSQRSPTHMVIRDLRSPLDRARDPTGPEVDLSQPMHAKRLGDLADMGGIVCKQTHQN
jgi:hypothetical protein